MKDTLVVVAALAVLLLGFGVWKAIFHVDTTSPRSYITYRVTAVDYMSSGAGFTFVHALPVGITCSDKGNEYAADFVRGIKKGCETCPVSKGVCRDELSDKYRKAFENQSIGRPYFSYDKGWRFADESFRIFFENPNPQRIGEMCESMAQSVRNGGRYSMSNHFGCVY